MRFLSAVAALMLLCACAAGPAAGGDLTDRDPLEGFNRAMWGFNRGADKVLIKPVSTVYRTVTPRPARRGLSRILANLTEPWSFVNNLLQGHPDRAVRNLGRFVVNTTIGVGGLADNATAIGIRGADEDFGQTLAVWGVKDSAYLVLPILGPSTVRDGIGSGVAFVGDPVNVCARANWCLNASGTERLIYNGVQVISARSDLTEAGADTLLDNSLDSYATARSAYLQRRRAAIANEDVGSDAGSSDAAMDAAVRDLESQGGEPAATDGETTPPTSGVPAAGNVTQPPAPATPPAAPGEAPPADANPQNP